MALTRKNTMLKKNHFHFESNFDKKFNETTFHSENPFSMTLERVYLCEN